MTDNQERGFPHKQATPEQLAVLDRAKALYKEGKIAETFDLLRDALKSDGSYLRSREFVDLCVKTDGLAAAIFAESERRKAKS